MNNKGYGMKMGTINRQKSRMGIAIIGIIVFVCSIGFTILSKAATPGQLEAENYKYGKGIKVISCAEGGKKVGYVNNGDYVGYEKVDLAQVEKISFRVSSGETGGTIEVRKGSPTGTLIGKAQVTGTGGWQNYKTISTTVSGNYGKENLYLIFRGPSGYLFDINYMNFTKKSGETTVSTAKATVGMITKVPTKTAPITTESTKTTVAIKTASPTITAKPEISGTEQITYAKEVISQSAYPKGIQVSAKYRVLIKNAKDTSDWDVKKHSTAVYKASPDYLDPATVPTQHKNAYVHFAQIDTNTKIQVRVELLDGTSIQSLRLLPETYQEVVQTKKKDKTWIEFQVSPSDLTKSILVEINEPTSAKEVLKDGLMFFVNPISQKPKGKVLELPSGIVDNSSPYMDDNGLIKIDKNSTYDAIYIPSNTIVNGRIEIEKDNFVVSGRGIITGTRWTWPKSKSDWETNYSVTPNKKVIKGIINSSAKNVTYEGIISVNPYHFNFVGALNNLNLKAFAWRMSSDGIHGEIIKGCFTRVNDDANYTDRGIIDRCNYWGMQNGAIFQQGWGQSAANGGGNTKVTDCNILRGEWQSDGGSSQNNGVFSGVMGATGDIKNVTFENIKVYGSIFRVIGYNMPNHKGKLDGFTFKNVWFEEKPYYGADNYLECGGGLYNFTFENVVIGGKKISSVEDLKPLKEKNIIYNSFKFK